MIHRHEGLYTFRLSI